MSNFVNYLRIRHHRRDENTGTLYTSPVDTVNGSFTFPRTWPLSFRETSTINISWSTKYEGVNLYYYQRGKVAASIQLATNLGTNFFLWDVYTDETNLTEPYVFRVVNARGTSVEQSGGGFWSTSFYITRDALSSISATSSSIHISTISSTILSTISSTISTTTTSNVLLSTPLLSVISSIESSSIKSQPSSTMTIIPTQALQESSKSITSLSTGSMIGIGIGSVLIILALVFMTWCFKRRIGRHQSRPPDHVAKAPPPPYWMQQPLPQELYTVPPELQSSSVAYELPHRVEY